MKLKCCADPITLFNKAVQDTLDDPGFLLPSPSAIEAHGDAVKLQQWNLESTMRPINYRILNTFLKGPFTLSRVVWLNEV